MSDFARGGACISVVLPVYNGEKYLGSAIQSVLDQSCGDFELVVIDDGSTDRTGDVIAGFADERLSVIRHPRNLGIVAALNAGIRNSRGRLIARMDADDLCHPRRFERQKHFLDARPEISICGTWFRTFGARKGRVRPPVDPEHIRARMFFGWAMGHPTLMMRRAFLEKHCLSFDEEFSNCEDYDFLVKASELSRLATIPEYLLGYRLHDEQVSVSRREDMKVKANRIRLRLLRQLTGSVTKEEAALHLDLADGVVEFSKLPAAENWLLRLDRENHEKKVYQPRCFRSGLKEWWHRAHLRQAASIGISALSSYWRSPLRSILGLGLEDHARLAAKSLIENPVSSWRNSF